MSVQGRFTPAQQETLKQFCETHGAKRLAFFGSIITDQFHAESDVDVLLEFLPGRVPGFAFFSLREELEAILGRRLDVTTLGGLHPLIQGEVMRNAQTYWVETPSPQPAHPYIQIG